MTKTDQHLKVDFGSILPSTSNSFNLTAQPPKQAKSLT